MNLSKLTDQSLHRQLKDFVTQERGLLIVVLEHLREVERRRLYNAAWLRRKDQHREFTSALFFV